MRTPDAYAATDGRGTLAIGSIETLDADDSLAQMIFHELCHSLVEGEESFARADWGMDNTGPDHDWREHACLRVQWVLTGRHGLRAVFAPTTEFPRRSGIGCRAMCSQIAPSDRWWPRSRRCVAPRLRRGHRRSAKHSPRARRSHERVRAVRRARHVVAWRHRRPGAASDRLVRRRPRDTRCGTCAWRFEHRGVSRCRQANAKIDPAWPGCERFEPALDCQTCGACCRAAYHSVEVSRRDPVVKKQPTYVVDRTTYLEIMRNGDRCGALDGGHDDGTGHATRYACVIYDDRPKTCRDFTLGSEHCLTARRRVGLSL